MSDRCGSTDTRTGRPCGNPAGSCPHHGNKGGRPTKYREEYDEQVYKLCLLGATDEQIADFFDVTVQTVHNWTDTHKGFFESRKKGKEDADAHVAESLYHRALGYEHDAVKILSYEGESWEHDYVKKYAPDTTAAIFWLKNRQPKLWRDRQEVDLSGSIEVKERSPRDELEEALDQLSTRRGVLTTGNGGGNGRPG